MKSILLIIIGIATLLLSLFSCSEDYLERGPLDKVTAETLTFSRDEMESFCNQYYANVPGMDPYGDNGTDNLIPVNYRTNELLSGSIIVQSSDGNWNWSTIRSVNYFLTNYHRTTEQFETIKKYVGEVYFWRAYFYYNLMQKFGDLPWYNAPLETTSEELYAPRLSRSVIADSILADLDKAIEYLPEKGTAEAVEGRLHRDAALLFKSRVALFEGTWEKYHANDDFKGDGRDIARFFIQAKDAAEAVISSQRYSLYDSYSGAYWDSDWSYWALFNRLDLSTNPEILMWRKYSHKDQLIHGVGHQLRSSGGYLGTGISKSLVNSYLCIDGNPISGNVNYQGDDSIASEVMNRDPRLWQTVAVRGYPWEIRDGVLMRNFSEPFLTAPDWPNTTGYQTYKYLQVEVEPEDASGNASTMASIWFRYAEVLLNYAEACVELGTCTQNDLDISVNLLRDRVGMPHMTMDVGFTDPEWEFTNISPLLNEIRRERKVELALEGFRFYDLLRWAASDLIQAPVEGAKYQQFADKVFNPPLNNVLVNDDGHIAPYLNSLGEGGKPFDPTKHYLRPIPTNELVLNPNMKQNPGY